MSTSVAHAEPTPAEIQAQLDKGNRELELVVEEYNKINGDLSATQAALAALETKLQPLQSSVDSAYSNVEQIAVTAYRTGSTMRTVSLLLSAHSSDTLIDQYTMLQQIARTKQHEITNFTDAKKTYDAEKKRLNELLAAQNAQKTDLETKKTKIEADIARLDALQKKINAGKTTTTTKYGPAPAVSGNAGKVVSYAWAQLGKKYVYGTAGPNTFDCSGLTMAAWKAGGVSLPHNAAQQWSALRHISRSQLAPGDLVFSNGLGHVGIYIGDNKMIHAPNSRTVVNVAPIDSDPIYGYGRP
jgi:cell wall-associated NlpC family hydrolase